MKRSSLTFVALALVCFSAHAQKLVLDYSLDQTLHLHFVQKHPPEHTLRIIFTGPSISYTTVYESSSLIFSNQKKESPSKNKVAIYGSQNEFTHFVSEILHDLYFKFPRSDLAYLVIDASWFKYERFLYYFLESLHRMSGKNYFAYEINPHLMFAVEKDVWDSLRRSLAEFQKDVKSFKLNAPPPQHETIRYKKPDLPLNMTDAYYDYLIQKEQGLEDYLNEKFSDLKRSSLFALLLDKQRKMIDQKTFKNSFDASDVQLRSLYFNSILNSLHSDDFQNYFPSIHLYMEKGLFFTPGDIIPNMLKTQKHIQKLRIGKK